jgi:hypothetical protein
MLSRIVEKLCFVAFLATAAGVVILGIVAIVGVPAECAKCPSICCLGIEVACWGGLGFVAIVALLVILTGVTDRHPSELPGHRGGSPSPQRKLARVERPIHPVAVLRSTDRALAFGPIPGLCRRAILNNSGPPDR